MDIYAFWEPKNKLPYYLQLCMETWRKFLPEANIHLLDLSNVRGYADIDSYGKNLFSGKFSLPQIADAIRAMILAKHGGIWLDCDTIILDESAKKYFNLQDEYQVSFVGDTSSRTASIAVISAKPKSDCMGKWVEYCNDKICNFNRPQKDFWAYLGNLFINPYIKNAQDVKIYDIIEHWPEMRVSQNRGLDKIAKYQEFYFYNNYNLNDVNTDMLMLHNSWTPDLFKRFNREDFLACSCTMTNILTDVLGIKRDKKILVSYSMQEKRSMEKSILKKKSESFNQEIIFIDDNDDSNALIKFDNDIRYDIFIPAQNNNFNFYRYDIPKGVREFYIKISGVTADFEEYTAGIFDFKNGKILRYETCKVSETHIFHFLVGKGIDNIALCIYAGLTRHTAGNELRIKELVILSKRF